LVEDVLIVLVDDEVGVDVADVARFWGGHVAGRVGFGRDGDFVMEIVGLDEFDVFFVFDSVRVGDCGGFGLIGGFVTKLAIDAAETFVEIVIIGEVVGAVFAHGVADVCEIGFGDDLVVLFVDVAGFVAVKVDEIEDVFAGAFLGFPAEFVEVFDGFFDVGLFELGLLLTFWLDIGELVAEIGGLSVGFVCALHFEEGKNAHADRDNK